MEKKSITLIGEIFTSMLIKRNKSLKKLNTFGISCKAKKIIIFQSVSEVLNQLKNHPIGNENILILGGGSNILFTKDFEGTILKSEILGIAEIKKNSKYVYLEVGSGVVWDDLVKYSVKKNYGGIENLSLIPGTVGAAPIQNIGAYGVEFEEVFVNLFGIDLLAQKQVYFPKNKCKFGYRDSIFKNELKDRIFITSVTIRLNIKPKLKTDYDALKKEIQKRNIRKLDISLLSEVIRSVRNSKLPDPSKVGNAGSFFKNPVIDEEHFLTLCKKYTDLVFFQIDNKQYKIPAGWLIEKAGLKGKRFGNVGIHEKQALVLVNYGKATGKEVLNLAKKIQKKIKSKFSIQLETEVNIIQ